MSDHECTRFYVNILIYFFNRMLKIFYFASPRIFHQPLSTWPSYNTLSHETRYILIIYEAIHVFDMPFMRVPKGYGELFYILFSHDLWIMFELSFFRFCLFTFSLNELIWKILLRARIELTTSGFLNKCSNHWAIEEVLFKQLNYSFTVTKSYGVTK